MGFILFFFSGEDRGVSQIKLLVQTAWQELRELELDSLTKCLISHMLVLL